MQMRLSDSVLWLGIMVVASCCQAAEPRVLIEGAQLELVAAEPQIVTPVGMTFDAKGRLFVIESHTHQRPQDYLGPAGDRIRMLSDSDGDGLLDQWSTFAEGFQQSMNLLTAGPGRIYLVTRRSVDLLVDDDRDGKMDRQESVLRLETGENYPHNALSGIAHDGAGGLYIGMGENFGAAYKLIGSDGSSYSDRGGVGTLFRCTADGKNLRRFSNGFWNPFAICTLPGGEVFTVDNDPDSSPPCRLIHAVESGDYGHRWEYSRAGIHPLQAWNGELPGTLPMLSGTGEAPCAVLPHRGYLWVTSWGDYRLERYELSTKGASFSAVQKIAVQGDSDFRPTGCAVAPDGSLYFADWVSRSYPVHGRGRVWRLSFGKQAEEAEFPKPLEQPTLPGEQSWQTSDPFLRQQAVLNWVNALPFAMPITSMDDFGTASERLGLAQVFRWRNESADQDWLRRFLKDESASVRLYAVRWIADTRLQGLRDDIEALLEGEIPDQQYYLQVLSALEWLDGEAKLRKNDLSDGLMLRELNSSKRPARLKAMALRLVSPNNKRLTLERLQGYLQSDHEPLRLEAVRTLALQTNPECLVLLTQVALDSKQSELIRAEAVAGLAASNESAGALAELVQDESKVIREETRRVQRLLGLRQVDVEDKPAAEDLAAWNVLLAQPGNAAAGRRLFFSARGARCGVCHQYGGRGGKIGPDLTRIGQSLGRQKLAREQLLASILQPSREIAPHYQPWVLQLDSGKTITALRLHKSGDWGAEIYADAAGKVFELQGAEIELRQASDVSIMPAGLEEMVSNDQLRDLLEFLINREGEGVK